MFWKAFAAAASCGLSFAMLFNASAKASFLNGMITQLSGSIN
jgi:hypothetical protein